MKKLLIITNLFWVSLFGFMAFKPTAPSSSYHLIDASLAKMMAQNYRDFYIKTYLKNNPMASGVGQNNSNDSRTIWFSSKKIREFMRDMEVQSLANSRGRDSLSGLRFYYIKYPQQTEWNKYAYFNQNNLPLNYKNLHSLMVVPTYFDTQTKTHVDYDPRRYGSDGKPTLISQVFNDLIAKEKNNETNSQNPRGLNGVALNKASIIMPDNSDIVANSINAGGLIPPPWNKTSKMTFEIPCSGADLMNYVDGIEKCGNQEVKLDKSNKTEEKLNFKIN